MQCRLLLLQELLLLQPRHEGQTPCQLLLHEVLLLPPQHNVSNMGNRQLEHVCHHGQCLLKCPLLLLHHLVHQVDDGVLLVAARAAQHLLLDP